MRRVIDLFYRSLAGLAGVAMVSAFAMVMLGIADRQFAWGLRGLDAYAGYAIAAALFLALPTTFEHGEQIRVTLVLQRLPSPWRLALEWCCLCAGLALTGFLAWYAVRMVWVSHATNDISQGSDATPLWLPQILMALGCIGLLVAFADALHAKATGREFHKRNSGGADSAARME